MLLKTISAVFLCSSTVFAAPVKDENRSGTVTPVPVSTIPAYTPYKWFAAAAYCTKGAANWTCGTPCAANSDFIQYAAGGDGDATPYWYVGWSPSLASIVVAHEGTDPTKFLNDLSDMRVLQSQLPLSYFPGISSNIQVHGGWLNTFERSAATTLATVKTIIAARASSNITVVGHSLGGALANLNAVHLKLQLPSSNVKIVTFGEPRVGNRAWADYASTFDITRITHSRDPIPAFPARLIGYVHPEGEIHIDAAGRWNACAGKDNPNALCSTGELANVFNYNILDHLGPYGPSAVFMGTIFC
ncbi:hypothetical protein FRB96_007307 [Tulasnella sp. 330]|nr:hypothetical protein FRB96_007307 [Tulasnella sp. 330]KAG8883890.1 hypothetical protein FRB97_005728 [Tulasnella sp. 331]KAG8887151.1 hypothetical protein FRB98_000460 [Tulasnella sp. 332]